MAVLSESSPLTPKLSDLRSELYIADHRTLLNYLHILEKAELLSLLIRQTKGLKKLQKPDKIYIDNTNLLYCLYQDKPNIGNIRETFFNNQMKKLYYITYPEKGDFLIDNKYTFEIGGKNKDKKQIADIPDAYLAIDDIETGFGNRIPLWLFGLIY